MFHQECTGALQKSKPTEKQPKIYWLRLVGLFS